MVLIYCIVDPELQNTDQSIMQNKESDNIDQKQCHQLEVKEYLSILCGIVSESTIKNSYHHCIFHDPYILFMMKPTKSTSAFFKGQWFQLIHYCSASVCSLTTRVSHRCNSQMIIKTQTVSL